MQSTRFALVSALLLAGAAPILAQPAGTAAAPRPPAASRYAPWGVDLSARDLSVKPGDDFWRYANNTWFQHNPIPADRAAWGVGTVLSEDVEAQLHDIVETANRGTDPVSRQVADMYASWMDEAGIEQRGAARAAPLSRPDRRRPDPRRPHPPVRQPGLPVADRRRHHPQSGRPDPLCRRHRPGRARHAQPRLLSARGRPVRRLSRRLPQLS